MANKIKIPEKEGAFQILWCLCDVPYPVAIYDEEMGYVLKCIKCGTVTDGTGSFTSNPSPGLKIGKNDIIGLEANIMGYKKNTYEI